MVNSLNEVITVLNNTIHTTTKKPIDVFIPLMNNLFNLVKNNTINSGKNYDSDFQYYKINDLIPYSPMLSGLRSYPDLRVRIEFHSKKF